MSGNEALEFWQRHKEHAERMLEVANNQIAIILAAQAMEEVEVEPVTKENP